MNRPFSFLRALRSNDPSSARARAAAVLAAIVLSVAAATTAGAATFTVDSTGDQGDNNPGNGKCRTSLVLSECTLRAAIMEANALAGGPHTIVVPAGTYTLTIAGSGDTDGSRGDLDLKRGLHINASGGTAIVRGQSGWNDRIFQVAGGITVTMSGLDLRGGVATDGSGGGGLRIESSANVTLTNVVVRDSRAASGGGGGVNNSGTLTLDHCTITGNGNPADPDGGGIRNFGVLVGQDGSIDHNSAFFGGGVSNSGTLSLTRTLVAINSAGASGGGLSNDSGATANVINCSLSANNAANIGGGIQSAGSLTLERSTLTGNVATVSGGGILNSGQLVVRNTTISGNTASTGTAGGLFSSAGSASLNNLTIANNQAPGGAGGIVNSATVNIGNTIVAGNSLPTCGGASALISQDFNLFRDVSGCSFTGLTSHNLVGPNPLLGALQNNGGSTATHALLVGSPAIDAANLATSGTGGFGFPCVATDQRGVARPQDGNADTFARCDIGAFEVSAVGGFEVSPEDGIVAAGEILPLEFRWTAPGVWRDLDTLELRLVDSHGHVVLWLLWDEETNSFRLASGKGKHFGKSGEPGDLGGLDSKLARLVLRRTTVEGSGPEGSDVTLTLALRFKKKAINHHDETYRIEVAATDDFGNGQGFDQAGTLTVIRK